MNIIAPCMTWVPIIWGQILGLFTQNITIVSNPRKGKTDQALAIKKDVTDQALAIKKDVTDQALAIKKDVTALPIYIIIDILGRAPAESVFQCQRVCRSLRSLASAPSFVEMHLNQTTPILLCRPTFAAAKIVDLANNNFKQKYQLCSIDLEAKKTSTTIMEITLSPSWVISGYDPEPFGSCNGLLLLCNISFRCMFCICNPITKKQVVVTTRVPYYICGFFFHPAMKEYRVLLMRRSYHWPSDGYEFKIFGLGTKCLRTITTNFFPAPLWLSAPVILNGILYWMVDKYDSNVDFYPRCSESIVLFNMDTEDFSTMPHPEPHPRPAYPGAGCVLRCSRRDDKMQLVEMEGRLCLCEAWAPMKMDIWVLEDCAKKVWVKRHRIVLEELLGDHDPEIPNFRALYIHDNVIFLEWCYRVLFYHLQLHTYTGAALDTALDKEIFKFTGLHTPSLVSFCSDEFIAL